MIILKTQLIMTNKTNAFDEFDYNQDNSKTINNYYHYQYQSGSKNRNVKVVMLIVKIRFMTKTVMIEY